MTTEIRPTTAELAPDKLLIQQQIINIRPAAFANTRRLKRRYLIAGPREIYLKVGLPLYEASIKCDWKAAKAIIDKKPELVRYSITENRETALHIAASVKRSKREEKFVKNLVDMMEKEDLALEYENFNTALFMAAAAGNIETVKIMVEKNRALLTIRGAMSQVMPFYSSAMHSNYEGVKYLYEKSDELGDEGWTTVNRGWLLEKCVEADMFDVALTIVKSYSKLETANLQLQKLISKHITRMRAASTLKETHSSRVLFIAAEMGNTNFLVELIRRYPDLIWKVNDNNQTIFHIAVKHLHESIYNLLYEIGSMKDLITPLRDTHENNMLHLAAKKPRKRDLQMCQELLYK